jgi:hypothetical protein
MKVPLARSAEPHGADSLICVHVFNGERRLAFVYREQDGFWTFLCGGHDHKVRADVVPVCHCCALVFNGVVDVLARLRPGEEARLDASGTWRMAPASI